MCEFCVEHGEGKKWYLQAKNYSRELWNEERKQFETELFQKMEENAVRNYSVLNRIISSRPDNLKKLFSKRVEQQKKKHWGQVVPMEEIEQILDMAVNIIRIPCVCRSTTRGVYDARYCYGITTSGTGSSRLTDYPDYSSDLEKLSIEEAKNSIHKHDKNGLVHSVWTFISPYIGGICNCTVTDCLAMKAQLQIGFQMFFKAEYTASIDREKCRGCKDCLKNCNFGAINYSPSSEKCYINRFQCYGCGVCRAVCNRDAISLHDRNTIPALANNW